MVEETDDLNLIQRQQKIERNERYEETELGGLAALSRANGARFQAPTLVLFPFLFQGSRMWLAGQLAYPEQ